MAGFDDLIAEALPYLDTETIEGTAGTTWLWDYALLDSTLSLVNISAGFTLSATIRDQNGVELVAPVVTSPSTGVLRCFVSPANSAIAAGQHRHEVTIVRNSDSAKIIAVGAGDSVFIVKAMVDV